jgi:hypothetical protein
MGPNMVKVKEVTSSDLMCFLLQKNENVIADPQDESA